MQKTLWGWAQSFSERVLAHVGVVWVGVVGASLVVVRGVQPLTPRPLEQGRCEIPQRALMPMFPIIHQKAFAPGPGRAIPGRNPSAQAAEPQQQLSASRAKPFFLKPQLPRRSKQPAILPLLRLSGINTLLCIKPFLKLLTRNGPSGPAGMNKLQKNLLMFLDFQRLHETLKRIHLSYLCNTIQRRERRVETASAAEGLRLQRRYEWILFFFLYCTSSVFEQVFCKL